MIFNEFNFIQTVLCFNNFQTVTIYNDSLYYKQNLISSKADFKTFTLKHMIR